MLVKLSKLLAQYQNKTLVVVFSICILALSGCGGGSSSNTSSSDDQPQPQPEDVIADNDTADSDFYRHANNAALLSGPLVGDATSDNSALVKELLFTLTQTDSPIEIRKVYMTRLSDTDTFPSIVAVIRNTSALLQCFVGLEGVQFRDSGGVLLAEQPRSDSFFTIGSTGDSIFSSSFTSRCLNPNEMVYAVKSGTFDFESLEMVSFTEISTESGEDWSRVPQVVLPIAYEVANSRVNITIANQSSDPLIIKNYDYFLLDAQGLLVAYIGGLISPDIELQPGAEAVLEDRDEFTGSTSSLRVVLEFDAVKPGT
jgi:hypothetical protein